MTRAVLPIAFLLVLAAATEPAVAATKKERQRICGKRGSTVDSSTTARVFEVNRQGDRALYGCMRADGRLRLLSRWFSCDCSVGDEPAPDAVLHARRFVEITERESCGPIADPACGGSTIALRDLDSGRSSYPAGPVAQVVARGRRFAYSDGRVVLIDRAGERVLDPGPEIEAGSLAFSRTRLYWTRDGQPLSAPLR